MTSPRPPARRPTPPHSAEAAKPADTRSLVQQIVTEQKEQKAVLQEAMTRRAKRSTLVPVAAVMLVLANVAGWLVFPPTRDTSGDHRTAAEAERDLRLVVASAASNVEVWRRTHGGGLPATLTDAGVRDSGLTFVKVDSTEYEIRAVDRSTKVKYQSNMAIGDFIDAGPVVKK